MAARHLLCRLAAAIGLALLVAGCLPESVNPVAPPDQAVDAPELLGLWRAPLEDAMLYVHVMRGEDGQLEIVTVSHEADGAGDTELYLAYVADIHGRRFANLLPADAAASQRYMLVGYGVDGSALTLRFLSPETLAEAIRAGTLTGEVSETSLGLDVRLTGAGAEIAAFLGTANEATLYGQTLTLQQMDTAP